MVRKAKVRASEQLYLAFTKTMRMSNSLDGNTNSKSQLWLEDHQDRAFDADLFVRVAVVNCALILSLFQELTVSNSLCHRETQTDKDLPHFCSPFGNF